MYRGASVDYVEVHTESVHLSSAQLDLLRRELGHLAISFAQHGLQAELAAAPGNTAPGSDEGSEGLPQPLQALEPLFQALEHYLPSLLESPLQMRAYAVGPVPIDRAPASPSVLLTRHFRPHQRIVLGRAAAEGIPRADYAWLLAVLRLVDAKVSSASWLDASIADAYRQSSGAANWSRRLRQLRDWLDNPIFADLDLAPPEFPSWVLSRSVPGAAILQMWTRSGMVDELAGKGSVFITADRMQSLPVARDSHLYELWVLLSVVEVLRSKFGFRIPAGASQDIADHATYDNGVWVFAPIGLEWKGRDPFGLKISLAATVSHEPVLWTAQGTRRTPDLVLRVEGGGAGLETTTLHVLDAKLRPGALRLAVETARDHYARQLDPAPTGAYVVLPGADASMASLAARMDSTQRRSTVSDNGCYGLAWGALRADPGSDVLGIRQFVTIALQYHRWELRHVCGSCGHQVDPDAMTYLPTAYERRADDWRLADAFRDSLIEGGALRLRGRLTIRCPTCQHSWSRQACGEGHLLMKHGKLTPHQVIAARAGDPDYNVACGVCGHSLEAAGRR